MNDNTLFSDIYIRFQHSITDDMYISWSKEETYEDLQGFLLNAIVKFRGAKVPIRKYNLEEESFSTKLNDDEIFILSVLMVIDWVNRQMTTVRLTEMQYTGSDAKVLNTKSQMSALINLKTVWEKEFETALKNYHYHSENEQGYIVVEKLGLSGKR